MQRLKKGTAAGHFWAQKKLKKRHQCSKIRSMMGAWI
jgi:hypothetical protein